MKKDYTPKTIKAFLNNLSGFKDFKVEYIEAGVSTEVYRLTRKDKTLYFRIASKGENISSEALAHKLLLKKGVFIPKVLINEDYNQDLGRSYMITDEIKGKDITEKGHNVETILHEAGKQLALANSIPIKNFGWMEKESPNCTELVGECSTYKQFAMNDERVTAMTNDLVSSNVISTHLKKKYLDYYYKQKPSFKCTQAYLAHGDFSTDHIYQLDGKYAGIIDWGDIRATSVYHDLGHFYTYSPNIFEFLLKGFLSVNKLQEDYMKNIELVAIQFAIGKLWWVSKNLPEKLDKKKHPTIVLMEKVLL